MGESKDKIYQIGVMLGNARTSHPREVITGIYDAANDENVEITLFLATQGGADEFWHGVNSDKEENLVADTENSFNYQYNSLYDYGLLGSFDAIIMSYGTLSIYFDEDKSAEFIRKFSNVPLIILERDNPDHSYIKSDNYMSMRAIVEHLTDVHGYKKILHLSGPDNNLDAFERKRAYLDVMKEHGYEVTPEMVIKGDYTPNVDNLVRKLLNDNPGAEAIVAANDEMTIGAYHACHELGLTVGKDIAITGYDDIEVSQRFDPPLTTANQDGVDMGYRAVKAAIAAIKTGKREEYNIPAFMKIRGSCGCDYLSNNINNALLERYASIKNIDDVQNIAMTAHLAIEDSLRKKAIDIDKYRVYCEVVRDLIVLLLHIRFERANDERKSRIDNGTVQRLRRFFDTEYDKYIDLTKLLNNLHSFIRFEAKKTDEYDKAMLFMRVSTVIDNYVQSMLLKDKSDSIEELTQNNYVVPSDIQAMMNAGDDEEEFIKRAMALLKVHGVRNAYIYLNHRPIAVGKNDEFKCPDNMYMAGCISDGKIATFEKSEAPVITKENGFSKLYSLNERSHQYMAFLLFQQEYQYGILLCEAEHREVDDIFGLSLQISVGLAYMELSKEEARAKAKLYAAMESLEEKNKVLSFVSANDQLTGIFNRRGFMEQVLTLRYDHEGAEALLFFFDLDHLKEINDVFGHAEGDFAIIHAAKFLEDIFTGDNFCARLGGDEFVAVRILSANDDGQEVGKDIIYGLKKTMGGFNDTSDKPYYLEFSAGFTCFKCEKDFDFDSALKEADNLLYEAKSVRRKSIRK